MSTFMATERASRGVLLAQWHLLQCFGAEPSLAYDVLRVARVHQSMAGAWGPALLATYEESSLEQKVDRTWSFLNVRTQEPGINTAALVAFRARFSAMASKVFSSTEWPGGDLRDGDVRLALCHVVARMVHGLSPCDPEWSDCLRQAYNVDP
jgi:hypothetical protein